MEVEILFHTSSTPKILKNVYAVYTKDGLLCLHMNNQDIYKYPLCNVFSVVHKHGKHKGTNKKITGDY